jgi:hypothetical protein
MKKEMRRRKGKERKKRKRKEKRGEMTMMNREEKKCSDGEWGAERSRAARRIG